MSVRCTVAFTLMPLLAFQQPGRLEDDKPIGQTTSRLADLKMESERGKNKIIYRVKNDPRGLFMPVRWKHGSKVLLEWNVPPGPNEWHEVEQTSYRVDKGSTDFGYGANRDQFKDRVIAYRDDPFQEGRIPVTFPPYTTKIRGVATGKQEKTWKIDLTVTSSFDEDQKLLTYEVVLGKTEGTSPLFFPPVVGKPDFKRFKDQLVLVWKSVEEPLGPLIAKSKEWTLSTANRKATFELGVNKESVVLTHGQLFIMLEGDTLVSTVAPAYVPKPR
ncbi:MAG: hypothetical protein L0Y72_26450 [Gemmataceae bacterium]|nr:hypothetical protein [Gemmataceae bacterium]